MPHVNNTMVLGGRTPALWGIQHERVAWQGKDKWKGKWGKERGKGEGLPLPAGTEGSLSFSLCAGVVLSITNQFCAGFGNC